MKKNVYSGTHSKKHYFYCMICDTIANREIVTNRAQAAVSHFAFTRKAKGMILEDELYRDGHGVESGHVRSIRCV